MEGGFKLWKDDETPLYVQAADAVRARILGGEYRPGDRLPSVRRLSDELCVNPATVVAAYRILTREGFVEARTGSGAYVAEGAPVDALPVSGGRPQPCAPDAIDMSANAPPLDLFPIDDIKRFIAESIDADGGRALDRKSVV